MPSSYCVVNGSLSIRVGQYDLDSLDALRARLAQYPRNVVFTVNIATIEAERAARIADEITTAVRAHGHVIER